jgi:hypothetical protein
MKGKLESYDLVGDTGPVYYNIQDRSYRRVRRDFHAPLCATGLTGDALNRFKVVCSQRSDLLDMTLWRWRGDKHRFCSKPPLCVGIKGVGGRNGVTNHSKIGSKDSNFEFLAGIIGDDIENYINL